MALMDLLPSKKEKVEVPATEPKSSHQGLLEIGGAYPTVWDTADETSVTLARLRFDRAILSGYTAQSYKPGVVGFGGSTMDGEMTREFDPEADVVRMSLPYAGG